uniref:Uncharacterized protein n=1 Tax=Caenorhabditis japonica TaxID=281687 RepID=A0A8R1EUI8_CAEJA
MRTRDSAHFFVRDHANTVIFEETQTDNGRVRGDDGWRFGRAGSGGPSNRCGGGEGGEGGGGGNDRRVDDRHSGGGVAARNGYGEL